MELSQVRNRWNEVLDLLEKEDRMAWIAFFDARLAQLKENTLHLDFSDSRKFAAHHDYVESREKHLRSLQNAIHSIFGIHLEISEIK